MRRLAIGLAAASAAGASLAGARVKAPCDLRPRHLLVSRAILHLKSATETAFQDQHDKDLEAARRQLEEALFDAGQTRNPAAWYYLGRYYVATTDLAGADSAFGETVNLAPGCADEVNKWRRVLWVPVINAGVAAWQAGDTETAVARFRQANALYAAEPTAFRYLATLFAARNQLDSAAAYFDRAREARDPHFAAERKDALFNLARIYHRAGRWDDAVRVYTAYLDAYPEDLSAQAGLVAVYFRTGQPDRAARGTAGLLARADSARASEVFAAGLEMRQALPSAPDTARAVSVCRDSVHADTLGVAPCDSRARAVWGEYQAALEADAGLVLAVFRAGLSQNGLDRAALFSATQVAIIAQDPASAETWAARLYALDPSNRATLHLVAQAWASGGQADSAAFYQALADSLGLDVTAGTAEFAPRGASLSGAITNAGRASSAPCGLGVDFLDRHGAVVARAVEAVPALEPGETWAFGVKVAGDSIAAWRYRVERGAP